MPPSSGDQTVDGIPNRGDPQRVAFRVRIVAQQLLGPDRHHAALLDGERIADPDRRIVDRTDGNRDQCGGAVYAVGDGVGETAGGRLGPVVPVEDGAAVESYEAVVGAPNRGDAQGVAFRV